MTFTTYVYIAYGLVLVQLVGSVAFAVWLYGSLPRAVGRKYPLATRLRFKLTLGSSWCSSVQDSDVPIIRRFRRAFGWFLGFSCGMVALQYSLWVWVSAASRS